jgi:microcystin-dependent protein
MSYSVNFTDEANKGNITVEDGAINTETSVNLPGRLTTDYGRAVNENFLHLLENFANASPPSNPVEGQLWYDTTQEVDQLKIYDGTNWVAAGGLKKGSFEPDISNSVKGDLWVNTSTSQLYLYTGSGWLLVGPSTIDGAKAGAIVEEIIDTTSNTRTVVVNYAYVGTTESPVSTIVSIISAEEFSPKTPIAGYSSSVPIKKGVNFNKNLDGAKFNGTATLAENLLISGATIPTSTVMRNNIVNQVTEKLQIKVNQGVEIGTAKTLSLLVEGNNGIIENTIPGAPIDLRVNNNGTFTIPIRVKSNTNVGINNLSPTESLDVVGNIKTDSNIIVNGTTQSNDPITGSITTSGGLGVAKNLNVGGNFSVEGNSTIENLLPDTANLRNIGSSVLPFDTLYANRITGNLTGNVTGNVSGTAGSTGKLNSTTTFGMTGQITSGSFTFDGQTGGNVKTFATLASPTIISDQTASASIDRENDTLLIYRESTGLLEKATPTQLIGAAEVLPVGTITMFGGPVAPTGWFICDGEEYSRTTYSNLATALGYNPSDPTTYYYGTPSSPSTLFRVPDLRGQFPTMATSLSARGAIPSNAISSGIADLGSTGGDEEVTLLQENLPEHKHDLRDGDNNQYYSTSTATYTGTDSVPSNGDTAGTGTRLETSGGVIDVQNLPVNIVNPYVALNFIIYHGVA